MPSKHLIRHLQLQLAPAVYRRCLRHSSSKASPPAPASQSPQQQEAPNDATKDSNAKSNTEDSALSRRFAELSEAAVLSSPNSTANLDAANAAALTDDLKSALAARLAATDFTSQHAQSISLSKLPASAPKHSRDTAAARPWTGTETTEDAVLRMLVDSRPPPMRRRSPAARLEHAKDTSAAYSAPGLTAKERTQLRSQLRDRFTPDARPIASVSALASLADQRIAAARAEGAFSRLPSGPQESKAAAAPFVDTTEYLLNRIVKRQAVLPGWVGKQQELAAAVDAFRAGVRREWRRVAARGMAARGGGVEVVCKRAEGYAKAEAARVRREARERALLRGEDVAEDVAEEDGGKAGEVFRDPEWERAEHGYHTLAIAQLNQLTRNYNLLAPALAQKPLLSLPRELARCYADSAPHVAGEIRQRALRPKGNMQDGGRKGRTGRAAVYESPVPKYGIREFWRDLWGK
ncbi:hypothetical protein EDC01DRAFT_396752 [Geopyxis carbonaria]|nr:hypothetical protein EDC01DRAFT_396752 [Geopyxis carbonaria]